MRLGPHALPDRLPADQRASSPARPGKLDAAAALLPQIVDLLKRGIECGAVVDPWNILGFDAHFSLFPALENSVRDHRADELVALMDRLWALYSQRLERSGRRRSRRS